MQPPHFPIYKEIGRDESFQYHIPPLHNHNPHPFPAIQQHGKTSKPSIKPFPFHTMEPSQNNREIGWSDSSDSEAWIDDEEMGVHNVHENNSIRRRVQLSNWTENPWSITECFGDNALWVTYLTEGVSLYEECNLY